MLTLYNFFISLGLSTVLADIFAFFLFEVAKLSIILSISIFIFSLLRFKFANTSFVQRVQKYPIIFMYLGMAFLGFVSPFCSCSTIPAFITFISAGLPLGPAFTYLVTSPLIQETSFILLITQFGINVTAVYVAVGLVLGISAGLLLSRTDERKVLQDDVALARSGCCVIDENSCGCGEEEPETMVAYAWGESKAILQTTYKYILIGIGIGAVIHGAVPTSVISSILGSSNAFAPIMATIAGIPMYADDVSLIPIAKSLVDKGAGLGTSIAFLMSVSVVSLPSFILLKRVLKTKALIGLVAFLTIAIILIGYMYNFMFPIPI